VNLRAFEATADDSARLGEFRCSAGEPFEDDVEAWIRTDAVAWANDLPRALFQRRTLAFAEDDGEPTAIVAWQDITEWTSKASGSRSSPWHSTTSTAAWDRPPTS
jgi:hypothetical protein